MSQSTVDCKFDCLSIAKNEECNDSNVLILPIHLSHWNKLRSYLYQLRKQCFSSVSHMLQCLYHLEQLFYLPNYQIPENSQPVWIKQCAFTGLAHFLQYHATELERSNFLINILPHIIDKTLQLDAQNWRMSYLMAGENTELCVPWELNLSLLSAMFLCLIPKPINTSHAYLLNDHNFARLFKALHTKQVTSSSHKLRCVLEYFDRSRKWKISTSQKNVSSSPSIDFYAVRIRRKRFLLPQNGKQVEETTIPNKVRFHSRLIPFILDSSNVGMEGFSSPPFVQVDFANAYLGGGVLGAGCCQEEIQLITRPSLLTALLFTERLEDNESLMISLHDPLLTDANGVCVPIPHRGYGSSFHYISNDDSHSSSIGHENALINDCRLYSSQLVAIDAVNFKLLDSQYFPQYHPYSIEAIQRDLIKAYTGFYDNSLVPVSPWKSSVDDTNIPLWKRSPDFQERIGGKMNTKSSLSSFESPSDSGHIAQVCSGLNDISLLSYTNHYITPELRLFSQRVTKNIFTDAFSACQKKLSSSTVENMSTLQLQSRIGNGITQLNGRMEADSHQEMIENQMRNRVIYYEHENIATHRECELVNQLFLPPDEQVLHLWAEDMSRQLIHEAVENYHQRTCQIEQGKCLHRFAEEMTERIIFDALSKVQQISTLNKWVSNWCSSRISGAVKHYAHISSWAHTFCQRGIQEGINRAVILQHSEHTCFNQEEKTDIGVRISDVVDDSLIKTADISTAYVVEEAVNSEGEYENHQKKDEEHELDVSAVEFQMKINEDNEAIDCDLFSEELPSSCQQEHVDLHRIDGNVSIRSLRRRSISEPELSSISLFVPLLNERSTKESELNTQTRCSDMNTNEREQINIDLMSKNEQLKDSSILESIFAQQSLVQRNHQAEFERLLRRVGSCLQENSVAEHRTFLDALNLAQHSTDKVGLESGKVASSCHIDESSELKDHESSSHPSLQHTHSLPIPTSAGDSCHDPNILLSFEQMTDPECFPLAMNFSDLEMASPEWNTSQLYEPHGLLPSIISNDELSNDLKNVDNGSTVFSLLHEHMKGLVHGVINEAVHRVQSHWETIFLATSHHGNGSRRSSDFMSCCESVNGSEEVFEDCIDVPYSELESHTEHWSCKILAAAYWDIHVHKHVNTTRSSSDNLSSLCGPLVTGNWGCGVFGGDPQLKCLLQWLAASETNTVPFLVYSSYSSPSLIQLPEVLRHVNSWSCHQLYGCIYRYSQLRSSVIRSSHSSHPSLFDHILSVSSPPSITELQDIPFWYAQSITSMCS